MTVSIGTFDDLQPDRPQPVDRNPSMDCKGPCDQSFAWRDYWKPRVVEGDRVEEGFDICPECLPDQHERYGDD